MVECIAEDDLLELAQGGYSLSDRPSLEAHIADCQSCSSVLSVLLAQPHADAEDVESRVGEQLGPYRLESLIGAGAMGQVYRGLDERLDRAVAIKVLGPRFRGSADRARRLEVEGRAAAAIKHPNVVDVYDSGEVDGVPFIVYELIVGESLRSVIRRGELKRETAIDLSVQLATGVAAAHSKGVVHRDIKPENLIVADDGLLKILDFGLAKVSGGENLGEVDATKPGTLLGTAGYFSPEQARGEPADSRSDVFAIGAVMYELLGGRRAFAGATFADRLSAVLRDSPASIDDPLDFVVRRCLEKDPGKRFQSAADLAWLLRDQAAIAPSPTAEPEKSRGRGIRRRTFLLGAIASCIGGAALARLLANGHRPASRLDFRQLTYRPGRVASARFTGDGGSIIYSAAWDDQPTAIFSARLGGGGTRSLDLPPAQLLAVSSKGELALSLDHRFHDGFHQLGQLAVAPLEGGQPRRRGLEVQDADFTPDGLDLAVIRRRGGMFQLELPVGRVLLSAGWLSRPRISPSGSLVACLVHDGPRDNRGDVVVVDPVGGGVRTIVSGLSTVDGLAWAPDGKSLWISASREGGNNAVRKTSLEGSELQVIPTVGRLRIDDAAADGTELAVTQSSGRLRLMAKAAGASEEVDAALSDVSLIGGISPAGERIVSAEFGDVSTARGC